MGAISRGALIGALRGAAMSRGAPFSATRWGSAKVIEKVVIEGDSITSLVPGDSSTSSYAWQWKALWPSKTIDNRAQGSRSSGRPVNLNDNGNTLFGNVSEDLAYSPDLLAFMIGANGLGTDGFLTTKELYLANLATYTSYFRDAGAKVAIASPTPYDQRHGSYTPYMAAWVDYVPYLRANYKTLADVYIPMGEIPEFNTGANPNPCLSDGVHWSPEGTSYGLEVFKAAMDPIVSGATATAPPGAAWFGNGTTNAPRNSTVEYRYVVTGLLPGHEAALSVSGTGVTFSRGSAAFGTTPTTVVNGDVVRVRVSTSSSFLTNTDIGVSIGGVSQTVTVRTGATDPASTTFDPAAKRSTVVLTNNNLTMNGATSGGTQRVRGTTPVTSGKRYAELTLNTDAVVQNHDFGFCDSAYDITQFQGSTDTPGANYTTARGATFNAGKNIFVSNNTTNKGLSLFGTVAVDGDVLMMAVDCDVGKVWFGRNGTWNGNPATNTGGFALTDSGGAAAPLAAYYLFASSIGLSKATLNCGQSAFVHGPPSGFSQWG